MSSARNKGLENVSGEWLLFLDSDDVYVNKDKLANEMQLVSPNKIAFSQFVLITENGERLPHTPIKKNLYSSLTLFYFY